MLKRKQASFEPLHAVHAACAVFAARAVPAEHTVPAVLAVTVEVAQQAAAG